MISDLRLPSCSSSANDSRLLLALFFYDLSAIFRHVGGTRSSVSLFSVLLLTLDCTVAVAFPWIYSTLRNYAEQHRNMLAILIYRRIFTVIFVYQVCFSPSELRVLLVQVPSQLCAICSNYSISHLQAILFHLIPLIYNIPTSPSVSNNAGS